MYPLEIIKTRIALSSNPSVASIAKTLVKENGIAGFYRGLSPSIYGIFPYAGADLMMNSYLKDVIASRGVNNSTNSDGPSIASLLLCGVASSSFALTVTYPIGLVRTRLQASGIDPTFPYYSSPFQVVSAG